MKFHALFVMAHIKFLASFVMAQIQDHAFVSEGGQHLTVPGSTPYQRYCRPKGTSGPHETRRPVGRLASNKVDQLFRANPAASRFDS
jgi:hypothetical protein